MENQDTTRARDLGPEDVAEQNERLRVNDRHRHHMSLLQGLIKGMASTSVELGKIERTLVSRRRQVVHEARVGALRQWSRAAQLAYGFLRAKPYDLIEGTCHDAPNWSLVRAYILQHTDEDPRIWTQRYAEWLDSSAGLQDHLRERLDDADDS